MMHRVRFWRALGIAAISIFSIGCDPGLETGAVRGVVTQDGEPLERVMVYFMPDPERATPGNHSTAVTDSEGRYELKYTGEDAADGNGATVGWHKVTLEDLVPENYRGPDQPPQSRIPDRLREPWKSPLEFEVKPGEQEFDIEVPPIG